MKRGGGSSRARISPAYQPRWREPLRVEYRGHTLWTMPPSSSGGVTLAMILNILERLGPPAALRLGRALQPRGRGDAAARSSTAIAGSAIPTSWRCRSIGCSRGSTQRELRRQIVAGRAATTPLEPAPAEGEQTTHYSIVDGRGNAVAVTTTINSLLRQRRGGRRRRLPAQRRDGRLRGQARHAEPVRAGAGRVERDRARQADAVLDEPDHRRRPARRAVDGGRHPRRRRPSSPACSR